MTFDATGDGRTDVVLSYSNNGQLIVEFWKNSGSALTDSGALYTAAPADTGGEIPPEFNCFSATTTGTVLPMLP